MLTVALPKGRIGDDTLALFSKIIDTPLAFNDRKLILENPPYRFLAVRNQDVPTYTLHRSADLGVVGLDVLQEKGEDLVELLDLGFGICRIVIAIKDGTELDYSRPELKVATKMPYITKQYFDSKAMAVEIVKLYGSIELAPLVGLSDAIVDIVETGSTLKQNGLKEAATIMTSSARLVANRHSFVSRKKEILTLVKELEKLI